MPVEIMLLPRWFPFHLDKISYWARTVLVPLTVLNALKPRARNPKGVRIDELFVTPPEQVRHWPKGPHQTWPWSGIFGAIDRILRVLEPYFPRTTRKLAIERARRFVTERLNGEDGLGAIFPAMANSVLMFDALGYPADHPDLITARSSLEKLLVVKDDEAYCQPCLSPVWDTALATHALLEVGGADAEACAQRGLEWLKPLQVLDTVGDWAATPAKGARPAAGPFNMPIRTIPMSTIPRSSSWPWTVPPSTSPRARVADYRRGHGARPRMGRGDAEQERRLGGVRRRQHLSLSQSDSLLRPRRAARSADGRRDGALRFHAGAARRCAGQRARRSTRPSPT